MLGSSVGARVALELAIRGRARSRGHRTMRVGLPAERIYQGAAMGTARLLMHSIRPLIDTAARFSLGRALLLTNMRSAPWLSSQAEARALRDGFADSPDFWQQLWWAVLMDVPLGLEKIQCPVILAQGTLDVMSTPQTLRYLAMVPGSACSQCSEAVAPHTPTRRTQSSNWSGTRPRQRERERSAFGLRFTDAVRAERGSHITPTGGGRTWMTPR